VDRAPEGEAAEPGGRVRKRLRRQLRARFPGDAVDELRPPEEAPEVGGDDDPAGGRGRDEEAGRDRP
jgi:hypothetical protein